ncbi:MAG: RcnB family protein [Azoarcus sp.]|nr:RcnB family protein [Azoarcus sp.]
MRTRAAATNKEGTMKLRIGSRAAAVILLAAGAFVSASVMAAPHDRDHHHPSPPQGQHHVQPPPPRHVQPPPPPPQQNFRFDDRYRGVAHDYYRRNYNKGRCPDGLSRRGGYCSPSPHKRDWLRGRALPRNVRYYDVPGRLVAELPPAPRGHRYVRVAGDILLIAIGTNMVVDALQDIFY